MRIVSLLPSGTEIVCALGCQDQMVGRSHECDYPAGIEILPVCSEPKLDTRKKSRAIDNDVRKIVQESLSVYRVHTDILQKLRPDIIVTQDQCEVCAVSMTDVERAVSVMTEVSPQIVSVRPNGLDDIWADIRRIARALDCPQKGEELIKNAAGALDEISAKALALARVPKLLCVEWIDPLMAAGNWIPEFFSMLGAECPFGEPKKHSPWVEWKDVVFFDPDIIIIMPCGFDIERTTQELLPLLSRDEWKDLKAVREKKVFVADGNQYFNRPGPRIVDSFKIMAEILYPDVFRFGYENKGWIKHENSQ